VSARAVLLVLSALYLGGCTGVQSALDPHGPRAGEIASLGWLLFAACGVVLLVVIAAAWIAMKGTPNLRGRLAGEGIVYAGGVVFPALVLIGLLATSLVLMRGHMAASKEAGTLTIEVTGEQWWWRVAYRPNGGDGISSANEISIPTTQNVTFVLRSADVIHSFWVPSLGGKVDMIPGRTTKLVVSADRAGFYRGQCAEYCGGPHALMALPVRAMPPAEFDAWLAAQRAPARSPSGEHAARGQELFASAGCAGCHAIRGTDAQGLVGPDLTHVGSRLSVGVDTLPMSAENLAQFVTSGQHIKPGNRMPEFRIFSDEELTALATYLAGLK
jgi:cytochrome c oxidase subunit II